MKTITMLLAALALLGPPSVGANDIAPAARITGTVTLQGCAIDPNLLQIEAAPVQVTLPRRQAAAPAFLQPRRAAIVATEDPQVVRFHIQPRGATTLQRIRIGYPAERCGKAFWRGPEFGLVMPGGAPVLVEGVAATTEVEVLEAATGDWVGATRLDLGGDSQGRMRFRWKSRLAGVTHGELQVATSIFPTSGRFDPCAAPPGGILHRAIVPLDSRGYTEIPTPVDFNGLLELPDPRDTRSDDPAYDGPPPARDDAARRRLALVQAGAPLYVRIVPQTPDGPACNARMHGAHGWAMVGVIPQLPTLEFPPVLPVPNDPLEMGDGHVYLPPFIGGPLEGLPSIGVLPYGMQSYKTVKPHKLPPNPCGYEFNSPAFQFWQKDPLGCTLIEIGQQNNDPGLAPGAVLPSGTWFLVNQQKIGNSSNLLSDLGSAFGGLVTGAWNTLGGAVNYFSALYAEIKAAVIKYALTVLTALPGLNQFCAATGDACKAALEFAVAYGMAAIGMPPSLPNFEQLQQQGLQYLASQVAAETGVPQVLVEEALDYARNMLEEMAKDRGGQTPAYDWIQPYLGYDPATVEVVLRKNTSDPLPANLVLERPATPLFRGGQVPVPQRFVSGQELRVPIVLFPNFTQFAPPLCSYDIAGNGGCVPMAFLKAPVCRRQQWGGPEAGFVWQQMDCALWGAVNPPDLYYRDRWVQERVKGMSCAWVGAETRLSFGLGTIPAPPGLDVKTVAFVKPREWFQWSDEFGSACF